MTNRIQKFEVAFKEGLSYEEAAKAADIQLCNDLSEYWKLMELDAALVSSSAYFDRLLAMMVA